MDSKQKELLKKYVAEYPQLKALAERAESDQQAAKSLGDQIGRLNTPSTVIMAEAWEMSKIGIRTGVTT